MICLPRRLGLLLPLIFVGGSDGESSSPITPSSTPPDLIWREPVPGSGVAGSPAMFGTVRQNVIPRDRSFAAQGIRTVVFRAANAAGADVVTGDDSDRIRVVAIAEGNEVGYHPADPQVERVGSPTGLDLAARRYGTALVVAAVGEQVAIHHTRHLVRSRLIVPPGVTVVRMATPLTANAPTVTRLEAPWPS